MVRLRPRNARLEAEAAEKNKTERRKEAGLVAAAEEKGREMIRETQGEGLLEEVYLPDPDRIEEDEPALLVHALVEVRTDGYYSPRHRMPFNSINEGSKCV